MNWLIKEAVNDLSSADAEKRECAAGLLESQAILRKEDYDNAIPSLILALNDEVVYVRIYAVRALVQSNSPLAIQPLIEALESEKIDTQDPELIYREEVFRISVILGLGIIPSSDSIEPLTKLIQDDSISSLQKVSGIISLLRLMKIFQLIDKQEWDAYANMFTMIWEQSKNAVGSEEKILAKVSKQSVDLLSGSEQFLSEWGDWDELHEPIFLNHYFGFIQQFPVGSKEYYHGIWE